MGLEGAVRLGMRRELEAIEDPAERERVFDAAVAAAYERGQGDQHGLPTSRSTTSSIRPTRRRWVTTLFDDPATRAGGARPGKRRPNIDAW